MPDVLDDMMVKQMEKNITNQHNNFTYPRPIFYWLLPTAYDIIIINGL